MLGTSPCNPLQPFYRSLQCLTLIISLQLLTAPYNPVQVSYRIVLSVVAGLTPKVGVLWDSGEVASGATHLISYPVDAPPLRSDTRYYWVVRCSLDDGTHAESAAAASFTTGLLAPSDWLATWIRTDAAIGAPLFRKEFTLPALPAPHALHTPHAPWGPNSTAAAAAPPRVTLFVAGIGYNEVCSTGSNLHSHTPSSSPPPSPLHPYSLSPPPTHP